VTDIQLPIIYCNVSTVALPRIRVILSAYNFVVCPPKATKLKT